MILRFALSVAILASNAASAEIVFEGFYKLENKGQHVGYFMQRYVRDPQAKTLTIYAYMRRRGLNDKETSVAFKGMSRIDGAVPISSVETTQVSGLTVTKSTEFTRTGARISTVTTTPRGKKAIKREWSRIAPGVFLTAALYPLTDFSRLAPGRPYWYSHFMEGEGSVGTGILSIRGSATPVPGQKVFHVLNDSSGQQVESFVTADGWILGSRAQANGSSAHWVKTKEEAVGSLEFPTNEFTRLFGDLPEGKKNPWHNLAGFDPVRLMQSFESPKRDPRARMPSSVHVLRKSVRLPRKVRLCQ